MLQTLSIAQNTLEDFARRHAVHRLALFGSVLREDFSPDSDIDVLIEYETGAKVGFLAIIGQEMELTALLGRQVDLRTAQELSPYFRDDVLANAVTIYERD